MGLEIEENSKGNYVSNWKLMKKVLFAGGTGILPFFDLLHYLLIKVIYRVLSDAGSNFFGLIFRAKLSW